MVYDTACMALDLELRVQRLGVSICVLFSPVLIAKADVTKLPVLAAQYGVTCETKGLKV